MDRDGQVFFTDWVAQWIIGISLNLYWRAVGNSCHSWLRGIRECSLIRIADTTGSFIDLNFGVRRRKSACMYEKYSAN